MFDRLRNEDHVCTGNATAYYALDPRDGMHAIRLAFMRTKGSGVHCDHEGRIGEMICEGLLCLRLLERGRPASALALALNSWELGPHTRAWPSDPP